MPLVEWNDSFTTGVPEIDAQHRRWVTLVNEACDTITGEKGQDAWDALVGQLNAFASLFQATLDYAVYHFGTEERLMLESNYPQYKQHKAAHEQFFKMIHKIERDMEKGKEVPPNEFLETLRQWIVQHILGTDAAFGKYLRETCPNMVSSGATA